MSETPTPTLYEWLGGQAVLERLTTRFYERVTGVKAADFVTAAHEYYDVFLSNADGTANPSGGFVTIECAFAYASPYGGGLNIAEVDFNHADGTVEHGANVTHTVGFGGNQLAGSQNNAIDGDLNTWSTMGNTSEPLHPARLSITIGFPD